MYANDDLKLHTHPLNLWFSISTYKTLQSDINIIVSNIEYYKY